MAKKTNLENSDPDNFLDAQMKALADDGLPEVMPTKQGRVDDEDDEAAGETGEDESESEQEEGSLEDDAMERAKKRVNADQKKKKPVAEEEEEETQEEEPEKTGEEEEVEEETLKHKKPLPPSEAKIVEQRRLIKQQDAELKAYRLKEQQEKEKAQVAALTEQYKSKGYEDDVAADQAQKDVRLNRLEERQAIMDFKDEHEEALRRYPKAKTDILDIMTKCKASGLDPEIYMRVKYGEMEVESDRRAKASVTSPGASRESDYNISNAGRSAQKSDIGVGLSPDERARKAEFESMWRDGKPMTTKEWLDRKRKFGL